MFIGRDVRCSAQAPYRTPPAHTPSQSQGAWRGWLRASTGDGHLGFQVYEKPRPYGKICILVLLGLSKGLDYVYERGKAKLVMKRATHTSLKYEKDLDRALASPLA